MVQQAGQAPERGQAGAFLNQSSTPGAKVNFIDETATGSTSFVVSAGSQAGGSVNFSIYDPLLPTNARTSENVKSWSEAIIWPYFNIFVDNDNDFNYEFIAGGSLSAGQFNILCSMVHAITPNSGVTSSLNFVFKNFDASDHTIYLYIGAKYAITG